MTLLPHGFISSRFRTLSANFMVGLQAVHACAAVRPPSERPQLAWMY